MFAWLYQGVKDDLFSVNIHWWRFGIWGFLTGEFILVARSCSLTKQKYCICFQSSFEQPGVRYPYLLFGRHRRADSDVDRFLVVIVLTWFICSLFAVVQRMGFSVDVQAKLVAVSSLTSRLPSD